MDFEKQANVTSSGGHEIGRSSECPFVFSSDYGSSNYEQMPDVLQRLCITARIEGVTAHTLRHTFSSVAGDMGFSELTIAALLGHGKRGVTEGYIHIE